MPCGAAADMIGVDERVGEPGVASRAGGRGVDLDQQREVNGVRLIEGQHRLGHIAQFVDDGVASNGGHPRRCRW